jgi:hypothetical protein
MEMMLTLFIDSIQLNISFLCLDFCVLSQINLLWLGVDFVNTRTK